MERIDSGSRVAFGSPWSRISRLLLAAIGLLCGPDCRAQEWIRDSFFTRGLNAKGLVPTTAVLGPLQVTTNNGAPIWGFSEWWSQATVYGTAPTVRPSGAYRWSNAFKHVTLPAGTSTDSDVILYVDSIAQYNSQFRQSGQQWPHLLVEQTIQNSNTHWLSDLDEVRFHLEARLNSAYNYYGSGYDSGLHAAQFVIYFTVQYLQPGQTGFGDYLWFGLKLYDDRYAKPGLYANWDGGTSKYIYNIGIPFTDTGMTVGQWKTISGDLLPHIKTAFNAARAAGALPYSGNLADYKIGGMNMGWEVPGLSRVEMQFRNYSLMYAPKGWTLGSDRTALTTTTTKPDFYIYYPNNGNAGTPATRVTLPLKGASGFKKTGPGQLMLDAASNTISGTVSVSAGILGVSTNANSLPNVSRITVENGAQLLLGDFFAGNQTKTMRIAAPLTISGDGVGGYGALFTRGAQNTGVFEGLVTLAGNARIGTVVPPNTTRFPGGLTGYGNLALRAQGTSTSNFEIEAPFTHQGDTILQSLNASLTVRLYGANHLPTNTVLRMEPENATRGVTFQLNGFNQTLGGLSSTATNAWRRVVNNSATPAVLTIHDAGNRTFYGTLGNSTANENRFGVVKRGSGRWTIEGNNTYAGGTAIEGGTLALAGAASPISATPAISVGAGATLDVTQVSGGFVLGGSQTLSGSGTVSGAVAANGTLAPGGSIGTLTFTSPLVLGGTVAMELDKANAPASSDRIAVSGQQLTFGGGLVVSNAGPALAGGDVFTLFSAASYKGQFSSVALPPLADGLLWNTDGLHSTGTVSVEHGPRSLSVATAHGTATPPAGTHQHDYGTILAASVASPVVDGGTQYACTGWAGTGSVPPLGNSTDTGGFALTDNSSITWLWTTNYWLDTTAGAGTTEVAESYFYAGFEGSSNGAAATAGNLDAGTPVGSWTVENVEESTTIHLAAGGVANFETGRYTNTAMVATGASLADGVVFGFDARRKTNVGQHRILVRNEANQTILDIQYNPNGVLRAYYKYNPELAAGWNNLSTGMMAASADLADGRMDSIRFVLHENTFSVVANGVALLADGIYSSPAANRQGKAVGRIVFSGIHDTSSIWYDNIGVTVLPGPASGWRAAGSMVMVSAAPDDYYHFVGWSGDVPGDAASPRLVLPMDQARSVSAGFAPNLTSTGTPEWWLAHHGLTNFEADAAADTDGDGLPGWQEYVAGTDPTDPSSGLRIAGMDLAPQGDVIRWPSVAGRFYSVGWTTNLLAPFTIWPDAANLPATPPENSHTNPAPAGEAMFYRINVSTSPVPATVTEGP